MAIQDTIKVDSSEFEQLVSMIETDSKTTLEEIKSSLNSDFTPLTDAGLFTSCLASLKEAVNSIGTTYDVIATELKNHSNDYESMEDELANKATNFQTNYTPTGGNGNGHGSTVDDYGTDDTDDGTAVDPKKLEEKLPEIDKDTMIAILNFTSIVKDSGKSLAELLFDPENAGALCVILQKFYLTYGLKKVEYDDASQVQKSLLTKILTSEDELPEEITKDSIIKYKAYLTKIASDNNIEVAELVMDVENKDKLTEALKKLYEGETSDKFDSEYCESFKNFVDGKAKENNMTVDQVLSDVSKLL